MRFWEVVVLVVNFGFLYWALISGRKTLEDWRMIWPAAVAWLLVIIQVAVEGARWQMLPAYLTPLILTLYYFIGGTRKKTRKKIVVAGQIVLLTVYVVISVLPVYYFPVFSLKKPTGPFAVGTTTYHWVDEQRGEPNTEDPNDHRELMVQIWYPAADVQGVKPASYIPGNSPEVRASIAKWLGLPAISISHLGQIRTHSYVDVALSDAEKEYPVLIFSHGMGGFRTQNMFQVEELASHGYIVVGIDHPYDAAITVFPDGRIIQQNPTPVFSNAENDQHIMLWADDASFVLDKVAELESNDPQGRLTGRVDLGRIGMFGHSYGGALAYQMLMQDSRIKAAMDMDGALFGEYASEQAEAKAKTKVMDNRPVEAKPFFLMIAKETLDMDKFKEGLDEVPPEQVKEMTGLTPGELERDFDGILQRFRDSMKGGGLSLSIPQASHISFSDLTLYSPLLRARGEDAAVNHRMVNAFSLAFFQPAFAGNG